MTEIIELLTSDAGIKLIVGIIVAILGASKLSKETVERIDAILMQWAPVIVRAVAQGNGKTLAGLSKVTQLAERDAVKAVMKKQAHARLAKKLPPVLRKVPGVDAKIDDVLEASVQDLKNITKRIRFTN
jgi:hypothetical protein